MGKLTHSYKGYIGYIRIDSPDIIMGEIDVKSAVNTLAGMDRVFTHFLKKHSTEFRELDSINYPIAVRDGCWEVLIPFSIVSVLGVYGGTFLREIAKNDAKDKTTATLVKSALNSTQNVIKIAKHLKSMKNKRTINAEVVSTDKILIRNSEGVKLSVTKQQLDDYQTAPKDLLSDLAYPAHSNRTVTVGYIHDSNLIEETIGDSDRSIFYTKEQEKEQILPELKHGSLVELEGMVTKGNARSNKLGFEYNGHIITCEPVNNYITNYISAHYRKCRIKGIVSRFNENNEIDENARPHLHFSELVPISDNQLELIQS